MSKIESIKEITDIGSTINLVRCLECNNESKNFTDIFMPRLNGLGWTCKICIEKNT